MSGVAPGGGAPLGGAPGGDAPVVEVRGLDFRYRPGERLALRDVRLTVARGSRCLLLGRNGAGKTTLLRVLGGRHLVDPDVVRVLGRPAFHDTSLAGRVALLGGEFPFRVDVRVGEILGRVSAADLRPPTVALPREESQACVTGASAGGLRPPERGGERAQRASQPAAGLAEAGSPPRRVRGGASGSEPPPRSETARRDRLVEILGVDRDWHMDQVSAGQRRRVQLLLGLLHPAEVLLLDEVTSDLDLLARADLLAFLRAESDRGATLLYATHVLDELEDWATHLVLMEDGGVRRHEALADVGELAALRSAKVGSPLTRLALSWLRPPPRP